MNEQICKNSVLNAAKKLLSENLVARTWGNVSCLTDDGKIVITPSGLGYDKMKETDLVIYDPQTKKKNGKHKPSSEKGVHATAYQIFPDAGFVIHTHQTYASALSLCSFNQLQLSESEEAALGIIAVAEYALPGTKKLSVNVKKCFESGAKIVLMANHGAVVVGKNADDAFAKAKLLETVCERTAKTQTINVKVNKEKSNAIKKVFDETETKEFFCVYETAEILSAAEKADKYLYAQLDDIAQMAGRKIPVIDNADQIQKLTKKYNVVLIKNVGAVIRAKTQEDLDALKTLVQKACICYLHTVNCGDQKYLPAFEANLMRFVYKIKYSKESDPAVKVARKKEIIRVIKF
ncbi:MAG TPA: class II aldolase/adducin family protein, partial [Eubacteriales bacterium]|nr:class II aldolase/adducin family protein [Eubacteriales bacterium]